MSAIIGKVHLDRGGGRHSSHARTLFRANYPTHCSRCSRAMPTGTHFTLTDSCNQALPLCYDCQPWQPDEFNPMTHHRASEIASDDDTTPRDAG